MSVHPYGAKLPYSRDEDKALVEFVRQNNGWHRVRGKQFWETSFRSNREFKRSPDSARERFLKRIINFNAYPANRKLFTKDEIKLFNNTDSDIEEALPLHPENQKATGLRLLTGMTFPIDKGSQEVNKRRDTKAETKSKQMSSSNLTTDLAIQSYKKLMSIESFPDGAGLEQGIITSLETVVYSFELLLRKKGFADDSSKAEDDIPVEKFKLLVNQRHTGDVLIDRLPSTLVTLAMLAEEICVNRRP